MSRFAGIIGDVGASRLPGRPRKAGFRPKCSVHPDAVVHLDGYAPCRWSAAHRRPRYRCLGREPHGHVLSLPIQVRQPTDDHPDSGAACPHCEHTFERHEGTKTGRGFIFGHVEIARLLVRVGEGMSLRAASKQLREDVFRERWSGTSNQANLAVSYLDVYGAEVVEQLRPKAWPRTIIVDSTALTTGGYRDEPPAKDGAEKTEAEQRSGGLKAGTIMVAIDGTQRSRPPVLIQVQGGKDTESWRAFFRSLDGEPEWVVADLDPAISRAVRETWPRARLFHSRFHLARLMRENAKADEVPARVRLDQPIQLSRPIPWSPHRSTTKRWGDHPLMTAIGEAQRGPAEWAHLKAVIEREIPANKLALRSWIATNEPLVVRQWEIVERHGRLPLSTGSLEGKIDEWLVQIKRRAGRWQNARRLNIALGLITLRARGEAREARYAGIVRSRFASRGNASHLLWENTLGAETLANGMMRQMSWWRTWHDRDEPSLPKLVREAERNTIERTRQDTLERHRRRLADHYEEANDLRRQFGIPIPPRGRPKRPSKFGGGSLRGKVVADVPELLVEWDWDVNLDLDPYSLPASSKQRVAWRCALNDAHAWETRLSARAYGGSFCPFHMGNAVHPAESLAAYYPHLVLDWHPTKNTLRPFEISRSSGKEVEWVCHRCGHEWDTPLYQRTHGQTDCPACHQREASDKVAAGLARSRQRRDAAAEEALAS